MADFLTNLWESVFTPGTTPTLLIATNATFFALQLLLGGLLLATYSIHFAILSVLCGGLWYSINWFATELQAAQKAEAEAERLRKRKAEERKERGQGERGEADDEGEDTEREGDGLDEGVGGLQKDKREEIVDRVMGDEKMGTASGAQAVVGASRETRQRRIDEASSELSTDSEWEKVDEGR